MHDSDPNSPSSPQRHLNDFVIDLARITVWYVVTGCDSNDARKPFREVFQIACVGVGLRHVALDLDCACG